jgi:hypothetical protein
MRFRFTRRFLRTQLPGNSRPKPTCILHYIRQYKIFKEDVKSRARSTHGGEGECIQGFGGKARRKETTSKAWT